VLEAAFDAVAVPVDQMVGGEGEGIGAEGGGFDGKGRVKGGIVPEAAEAAGVSEADVGVVGEVEDDVGVFFDGGGGGDAVDAAGHAEVDQEGLGICGIGDEEELFAVAVGAGEGVSGELLDRGAEGGEEVGAEDGDGAQGDVEEVGFEGAADFFDFGEFGHGGGRV
jgi:hypothetical protein